MSFVHLPSLLLLLASCIRTLVWFRGLCLGELKLENTFFKLQNNACIYRDVKIWSSKRMKLQLVILPPRERIYHWSFGVFLYMLVYLKLKGSYCTYSVCVFQWQVVRKNFLFCFFPQWKFFRFVFSDNSKKSANRSCFPEITIVNYSVYIFPD